VCCGDASETSSADYYKIEGSRIGMDPRILASLCLVQRVADITADIIQREAGREREGCTHNIGPILRGDAGDAFRSKYI